MGLIIYALISTIIMEILDLYTDEINDAMIAAQKDTQ